MSDCFRCRAPILPAELLIVAAISGGFAEPAHRRCAHADLAEMDKIRAEACRQGYHQSPGRWTTDPDDPYGDASLWRCVRGCGYVRRHPGYGIGRFLAEAEGALLPETGRLARTETAGDQE